MEREPDHSGASEESGQLPEEAPPEVASDGTSQADEEREDSAGVPDNPGQATGHPENAG